MFFEILKIYSNEWEKRYKSYYMQIYIYIFIVTSLKCLYDIHITYTVLWGWEQTIYKLIYDKDFHTGIHTNQV